MSAGGARQMIQEVAAALGRKGLEEVEIFTKSGRTRRYSLGVHGRQAGSHRERGWAVRATGSRASLLASGTGEPRPAGPWPQPDGYPIQLPAAADPGDWRAPADLAAPLVMESEAIPLLEACAGHLERELPGAKLLRAVLEDGSSEVEIASTRGVDVAYEGRAASLMLEALGPARQGKIGLLRSELFAEREARRFSPKAVAGRLANRLVVEAEGRRVERDRGDFLLGPAVGARILAGCQPCLVGTGARRLARALSDRGDRLGSPALTIVDDARRSDGLLAAPVDGEGVPTRRIVLVDAGTYQRPLTAWWDQEPGGSMMGCLRRPGWRDAPRLGPSHLFIEPDPATRVATLLASVARGYYFNEVTGAASVDPAGDRFRLPVCGFQVSSGQPVARVARAVLCGRLSGLLKGIQAVGRDLAFFPLGGLVGSPSLLVTGVELDDS